MDKEEFLYWLKGKADLNKELFEEVKDKLGKVAFLEMNYNPPTITPIQVTCTCGTTAMCPLHSVYCYDGTSTPMIGDNVSCSLANCNGLCGICKKYDLDRDHAADLDNTES